MKFHVNKMENISYSVLFDTPVEDIFWDMIKNAKYLVLVVQNEEEYLKYESIFSMKQIKYVYTPYYNYHNLSFFQNYVFLADKEILLSNVSEDDLIIRSVINPINFGKFYIFPTGDISAHTNILPIGNLNSNPKELINQELLYGKTWKNTRKKEPCMNCMFELFCLPLNGYENYLGTKMCNVKMGIAENH